METGDKFREVTYNMSNFLERVRPRILSLEGVDYFGTTEYLSGRKKEESLSALLYEQGFSETSKLPLGPRFHECDNKGVFT